MNFVNRMGQMMVERGDLKRKFTEEEYIEIYEARERLRIIKNKVQPVVEDVEIIVDKW